MRDFLKICLTKDPKERPSVDELLTHPFIANMNEMKAKESYIKLLKKYNESKTSVESIFINSESDR
jgi:serine/threonine protein kinase